MQVVAHDCFQAATGQLELIGNGSALVSQSNASISPSSYRCLPKIMPAHVTVL